MSHRIRHLDLFVTESCNLACPYCFARDRADTAHMDEGLALRAIDWLCQSTAEKLHVTFWGGEPLLRLPWLRRVAVRFVERAHAAGKTSSISLPTNATLLTDQALDWIERENIKTFLSIDGDEATQAGRPLRSGANSHNLATKGLKLALSRRTDTTVRMTVTPTNVGRLVDNVRYFAKLGVRKLMIHPAYDQPWSDHDLHLFGTAERDVADMLAAWIVRSPAPHRVIRMDAWMPVLRGLASLREPRRPDHILSPCGAGNEMLALNVDGTWTPCHRFTFYGRSSHAVRSLGDFENGLDHSACDAFRGLRWQHQRGIRVCTECPSFALCSMGCVAINYAMTGSLSTVPAWACALQSRRIEACQALHDSLSDHPSYALYIGRNTSDVLRTRSDVIGQRAAEIFKSLSQSRGDSWQPSI